MSKAKKEDLHNLHELTAKMCLAIMRDGEVVKDENGVARMVTPSASMVSVVTKFLKDNNITDDGLPAPNAGRDLAAEARQLLDSDEEEAQRPN